MKTRKISPPEYKGRLTSRIRPRGKIESIMRTYVGLSVCLIVLSTGAVLSIDDLFDLNILDTIFPMVSSAKIDAVTSLVKVAAVLISISVWNYYFSTNA